MSDEKQINDWDRNREDTIKVLVGPNKQNFYLHEYLLDKVPYLKLQLRSNSSAIELQTVDATGFRYVVGWLYTGNLPNLVSRDGLFDEDSFDTMYKAADFLMMSELKSKLRAYVCPVSRSAKNTRDT